MDWYPWGPEALDRARVEGKPILLSIGYSACHWCHVMAHECFENLEIASLMNQNYINIKVDREERPDLDHLYQNVAQVFTQGGGWPLTVFLTPELKPFFGGTYFPPEDRYGRPGFPRVLLQLAHVYSETPDTIRKNAEELTRVIRESESIRPVAGGLPTLDELQALANKGLSAIDLIHGGLGTAPKFPNPMSLTFLWRAGSAPVRDAVLLSLRKMAQGGIFDQIGGGFHRYSVDETWSVPHFEKMLYDNGLLLRLYSEALLTPDAIISAEDRTLFLTTIEKTVIYLLREMRSSSGAFYSAQDADSEGEEGKYFAWNLQELTEALGETDARLIAHHYGVTSNGNFEHGRTVLYQAAPASPTDLDRLQSAEARLLAAREKRIPPATDDKILSGWNGLVISGLIWAAEAGGAAPWAETARSAARSAFSAVIRTHTRTGQRLYSTGKINAYLDDYAFMVSAALDLARFEKEDQNAITAWTLQAVDWMDVLLTHFKNPNGPGYFFTSDDHEELIHRTQTIYDQAIPAGISSTLGSLVALHEITGNSQWIQEAETQFRSLYSTESTTAYGTAELLNAALLYARGPQVLSGGPVPVEFRGRPGAWSPDWFRKASTTSARFQVCHRGVCR